MSCHNCNSIVRYMFGTEVDDPSQKDEISLTIETTKSWSSFAENQDEFNISSWGFVNNRTQKAIEETINLNNILKNDSSDAVERIAETVIDFLESSEGQQFSFALNNTAYTENEKAAELQYRLNELSALFSKKNLPKSTKAAALLCPSAASEAEDATKCWDKFGQEFGTQNWRDTQETMRRTIDLTNLLGKASPGFVQATSQKIIDFLDSEAGRKFHQKLNDEKIKGSEKQEIVSLREALAQLRSVIIKSDLPIAKTAGSKLYFIQLGNEKKSAKLSRIKQNLSAEKTSYVLPVGNEARTIALWIKFGKDFGEKEWEEQKGTEETIKKTIELVKMLPHSHEDDVKQITDNIFTFFKSDEGIQFSQKLKENKGKEGIAELYQAFRSLYNVLSQSNLPSAQEASRRLFVSLITERREVALYTERAPRDVDPQLAPVRYPAYIGTDGAASNYLESDRISSAKKTTNSWPPVEVTKKDAKSLADEKTADLSITGLLESVPKVDRNKKISLAKKTTPTCESLHNKPVSKFLENKKISSAEETTKSWAVFAEKNKGDDFQKEIEQAILKTKKLNDIMRDASLDTVERISEKISEFFLSRKGALLAGKLNGQIEEKDEKAIENFLTALDQLCTTLDLSIKGLLDSVSKVDGNKKISLAKKTTPSWEVTKSFIFNEMPEVIHNSLHNKPVSKFLESNKISSAEETTKSWAVFAEINKGDDFQKEIEQAILKTKKLNDIVRDASLDTVERISKKISEFFLSRKGGLLAGKLNGQIEEKDEKAIGNFLTALDQLSTTLAKKSGTTTANLPIIQDASSKLGNCYRNNRELVKNTSISLRDADQGEIKLAKETIAAWEAFAQKQDVNDYELFGKQYWDNFVPKFATGSVQEETQKAISETIKLKHIFDNASHSTLEKISQLILDFLGPLDLLDRQQFCRKLNIEITDSNKKEIGNFRKILDQLYTLMITKSHSPLTQDASKRLYNTLYPYENITEFNTCSQHWVEESQLIDMIARMKKVKKFTLDKRYCTEKVIAKIAELNSLEKLSLENCKDFKDLALLEKLSKLQELNLLGTSITSLQKLNLFKRLERLNLSNCQNLINIQSLAKHPTLKFLDLGYTAVTDNDLEMISKMKNLLGLGIYGSDKITDAGIGHLTNLTNLVCLDVSSLPNTTENMYTLIGRLDHQNAPKLCNLKELKMSKNKHLKKNCLSVLLSLNLQYLDLSNCSIGNSSLAIINKMASLEGLKLDQEKPKKGLNKEGLIHLMKLKNLQFLDVENTEVQDDDQMEVFGRVMPKRGEKLPHWLPFLSF